jgi:hypothetical protein
MKIYQNIFFIINQKKGNFSFFFFPKTKMQQPVGFIILSISLLFSLYATFQPDFLRISTPLFTQRFGIFQSCLSEGGRMVSTNWNQSESDLSSISIGVMRSRIDFCDDFPAKCSLKLPNSDSLELTFCQTWLVTRYLQVFI